MEVIYIIGSGPSGIACALGWLDRQDVQIIMLDVGHQLEPHLLKKRQENNGPILTAATLPPWEDTHPDQFVKHIFGSIYPYRIDNLANEIEVSNASITASLAKGGLSNIWGASLMSYRQQDIHDWPIMMADLDPCYKKIFDILPLATCLQNDLNAWPCAHDKAEAYQLSPQAASLWNTYEKHKEKLNKQGILAGGARLALHQSTPPFKNNCIYCNECMHGCPQDAVYSTRQTLTFLQKHPNFRYQNNVRVESVSENGNTIQIDAIDTNTQQPIRFIGDRVFLAAGVFMSTKILLNSYPSLSENKIEILDSQRFILPCLTRQRIKKITEKPSHSLSQLYYEMIRPELINESIHLQLYTYMPLFENELKNRLGLLRWMRHLILERFVVIQGYLPSSISGKMSVTHCPQTKKMTVKGVPNEASIVLIKQLKKILFKHSRSLGVIPLIPLLQTSKIGAASHYGGNFPMKKIPSRSTDTDIVGRPRDLQKIHLVDACIFPSIPAQSITLTVMANAYRIAKTVSLRGNVC